MLLIITCTEDVTSDMLIPFLDGVNVFRFNIDKWNEYIWDFSSRGFKVLSPNGKVLTSENIKSKEEHDSITKILYNKVYKPRLDEIDKWR